MSRSVARELRVRISDLDPNTHRAVQYGEDVGVTKLMIRVLNTDEPGSEPRVHVTGRVTFEDDFFYYANPPEWLQVLIDEALAEFEAMSRRADRV